ncbi:unnamed protein product, partial [Amoebophrya sp. A25]
IGLANGRSRKLGRISMELAEVEAPAVVHRAAEWMCQVAGLRGPCAAVLNLFRGKG